MNGIYTKHEVVTGKVGIWAVPKNQWDAEDAPPFTYQLTRSYRDGEVRVVEHEISLAVPAGINLISQSIETLELKRKEAFEEYVRLSDTINTQINNLRLLSGPTTAPANDSSTVITY